MYAPVAPVRVRGWQAVKIHSLPPNYCFVSGVERHQRPPMEPGEQSRQCAASFPVL